MTMSDARAVRSRRALMDGAVELLLRNPMASLSQIAAHAGVGRATLYRHFETREQLIQALAVESLEMTDEVLSPIKAKGVTGREALEEMMIAIMPMADRYHFLLSLWSVLEHDDEILQIYNRQLEGLAAWVEQGKSEGSINLALTTNWVVALIDNLIYSGWWMMASEEQSAEEVAHNALIVLFQGISSGTD